MLRAIGAIVAGLAAALLLIAAIGMLARLPAIATMPNGVFAVIVLAWGIGTFAGAFVAARFGRSAAYGFVIGAAALVAIGGHFYTVPSPVWMWASGVLVVVVTAVIAVRSALPARKTAT
jgi:hypothetical protein